jgi:hypothetical protein
LRISCGTVTWPLELIELEYLFFITTIYSKDYHLYLQSQGFLGYASTNLSFNKSKIAYEEAT